MLTVFIAHAADDADFAGELGTFLETGCDVSLFHGDGLIEAGKDLIDSAEAGLAADILILLISPASSPKRWERSRWEPVLIGGAKETGTRVAVVLLEECNFPALLRRGIGFCDATTSRVAGLRRLKRWVWGVQHKIGPDMTFSGTLDNLYAQLADDVGIATASGAAAQQFAREASRDFAAVLWVPAHGRTLAQISGEAGSQLGLRLPGPVEEDCRMIQATLSRQRCLLVLDAPDRPVDALLPGGRTSVLYTSEPVIMRGEQPSLPSARRQLDEGRVSEAFETLRYLMDHGIESEKSARELVWIYEQWDRIEEANALRFLTGPAPAEQLSLFAMG